MIVCRFESVRDWYRFVMQELEETSGTYPTPNEVEYCETFLKLPKRNTWNLSGHISTNVATPSERAAA